MEALISRPSVRESQPVPSAPAASAKKTSYLEARTEALMRDMAFVLQMARRVKQSILERKA